MDNPSDTFSGGTVMVNDLLITVPRNTLFQFPATSMTWQEMFKLAPAPWGPTQSGLARADSPAPAATYEVTIMGNRVSRSAGLIFLSLTINPAPSTISVTSSFGGSATAPVQLK